MSQQINPSEQSFIDFFNYFMRNGYTAVMYESPKQQTDARIELEKVILAEAMGWRGMKRGHHKEKSPLKKKDIDYLTDKVNFFNQKYGGTGWMQDYCSEEWLAEAYQEFHSERTTLKKYIPEQSVEFRLV